MGGGVSPCFHFGSIYNTGITGNHKRSLRKQANNNNNNDNAWLEKWFSESISEINH